jgi:hypothetical protein
MMLICTMVAVESNVPRQRRQRPRAVIYPLTAAGDTDMFVAHPPAQYSIRCGAMVGTCSAVVVAGLGGCA